MKAYLFGACILATTLVGCAVDSGEGDKSEEHVESTAAAYSHSDCASATQNCTNAYNACDAAVRAADAGGSYSEAATICAVGAGICSMAGNICRCADRGGIGC